MNPRSPEDRRSNKVNGESEKPAISIEIQFDHDKTTIQNREEKFVPFLSFFQNEVFLTKINKAITKEIDNAASYDEKKQICINRVLYPIFEEWVKTYFETNIIESKSHTAHWKIKALEWADLLAKLAEECTKIILDDSFTLDNLDLFLLQLKAEVDRFEASLQVVLEDELKEFDKETLKALRLHDAITMGLQLTLSSLHEGQKYLLKHPKKEGRNLDAENRIERYMLPAKIEPYLMSAKTQVLNLINRIKSTAMQEIASNLLQLVTEIDACLVSPEIRVKLPELIKLFKEFQQAINYFIEKKLDIPSDEIKKKRSNQADFTQCKQTLLNTAEQQIKLFKNILPPDVKSDDCLKDDNYNPETKI